MATATNTEKALIPQRLKGKVALVTGGSRGIGAAIAQRLAKEGATVAISYSKSQEAADKVVAQLKEEGVSAYAFKADASCQKDTAKLVDDVVAAAGNIDILVNNADLQLRGWTPQRTMKKSSTSTSKVLLPQQRPAPKMNDGGWIINIFWCGASNHPGIQPLLRD
ncbi:MAG: SDR family NAD(P)-dependent oxidoreductase [Cyanobacteriota/Melainabacteria group bacterium]